MEVTLLGTGDTTGTPTPGCGCDTCEAAISRGVERTRFSVHVEGPDGALVVDMSPDFRYQILREGCRLPDAVVVTHIHFDHLDGLGNAYRLLGSLPVHAANEMDPETGESVAETVDRKYSYLDRLTVHHETPFEPFEACGLELTLVPVDHPPLVCYGLRVDDPATGGTLAITGDTSYGIPEDSRTALCDADLLLADGIVPARLCEHHPLGGRHEHDGVPYTFGTKHMTFEGALALGDELDATETRIVHVSHFPTPEEAFGDALAVDGETYAL